MSTIGAFVLLVVSFIDGHPVAAFAAIGLTLLALAEFIRRSSGESSSRGVLITRGGWPMDPITPDEDTFRLPPGSFAMVLAREQPMYRPLPTIRTPDGQVVSQWLPTHDELVRLMRGEPLTVAVQTFNKQLFAPMVVAVGGLDLR